MYLGEGEAEAASDLHVVCFHSSNALPMYTLHVGLAFCSSAIARVLAEYVRYVLSSGI